jgi:hypothetical protein
MHDFLVRLPHIRRHSVTVQVHRGTDVRVTHELLLHADRSTDRIKPTAVSVPEDMRTDVMDAGHLRSVVPSPSHVSVSVWLASKLHRARKHTLPGQFALSANVFLGEASSPRATAMVLIV